MAECCLCPCGRVIVSYCEDCRDRYNILAKKWRAKIRREEIESGGGDEQLTQVEI